MSPYASMTTVQLHEYIEANWTLNEEDASDALMRLVQIAVEDGCSAPVCLILRMLADMPGLVSSAYATDIQSAADVEHSDAARAILYCAADILRTNGE